MTPATLLAFAAGSCGVVGAWDVLDALERAPLAAWLTAALRPLSQAHREGREPSAPEQRRLALLVSGCLVAAGWLLGGPPLGVIAGVSGPVLAGALIASRRRAYRTRLAAGAAPTARALAAALGPAAPYTARSPTPPRASRVPSATSSRARRRSSPPGIRRRRCSSGCGRGRAAVRGTRSSRRSSCSVTLAATFPACCATSPSRRRPRAAPTRTPAP